MKAGAKRGYQGQGDDNQPQLSPACTWLDAQHDARRGTMFLESITGTSVMRYAHVLHLGVKRALYPLEMTR